MRINELYLVGNDIFFWLLLWVFLCVDFFCGFVLGLFFVLGCGLGFVWLLLWLWRRFFNMVVAFGRLLQGLHIYAVGMLPEMILGLYPNNAKLVVNAIDLM